MLPTMGGQTGLNLAKSLAEVRSSAGRLLPAAVCTRLPTWLLQAADGCTFRRYLGPLLCWQWTCNPGAHSRRSPDDQAVLGCRRGSWTSTGAS